MQDARHSADSLRRDGIGPVLTGFALSLGLTALPFVLVMRPVVSPGTTLTLVVILAAVQVLVHLVFFLPLDGRPGRQWTLLSLVFTVGVVAILVGGSVWIMHSLLAHMMPH